MIGTKPIKKYIIIILLFLSSIFISSCNSYSDTDYTDKEIPSEDNKNQSEKPQQEEITKMYIKINKNILQVTVAKNSAVSALIEILKQKDITITVNDYGGFEKVGNLGFSLPTNNSQITTEPGDVILYSGNQIVIFYGSNTWSYTRLGKIEGLSVNELSTLLQAGKGSIQLTLSLNNN